MAACGPLLSVPVALAQKPGRVPGDDAGWLQWLIAAGLAIIVLLPAFINPKRSHLT